MSDASPDQDPDPENEKGAEGTGPDHIATAGGIVAVQGTKAGTGVQSISLRGIDLLGKNQEIRIERRRVRQKESMRVQMGSQN